MLEHRTAKQTHIRRPRGSSNTLWLKQIADVTERSPVRVERSGLGPAQVGFDLGEGVSNWIQIGAISRNDAVCQ